MGEMTDDFDAYSSRSPRLQYLDWIKRNHFDKNPSLEVVKCLKFPEFGKVTREDIDRLIEFIENCTYCQEMGCEHCMYPPRSLVFTAGGATVTGRRSREQSFDPNDLIGRRVVMSMDPGNPTTGFNYMIQAQNGIIHQVLANKGEFLDQITEDDNMEMDPEFYERQAAQMLVKAEQLRSVPRADVFENGQVLTFTKTLSGTPYLYAAIKANDVWFVSGFRGSAAVQGVDWLSLISWIGVSNLGSVRILDVSKGVPFAEYKAGVEKALQAATEGKPE